MGTSEFDLRAGVKNSNVHGDRWTALREHSRQDIRNVASSISFLIHETPCGSLLLSHISQRCEYGEVGVYHESSQHKHGDKWHLVWSLDIGEYQRMVGTAPNLKHVSCLKGAAVA